MTVRSLTTKVAAVALLALSLAGCVSQHDAEMAELQACGRLNHTPAYEPCIERYNARTNQRLSEAQLAQPVNDNSDGAAILLLGALSGFSQGRQPMPMLSTSCTTNRGITNCLSF
jgi:hypothetical protein